MNWGEGFPEELDGWQMSQSVLETCLYLGQPETFVRFINAPYDEHCFAISLHEWIQEAWFQRPLCFFVRKLFSRAHAPLQRCPRNASSFHCCGRPRPAPSPFARDFIHHVSARCQWSCRRHMMLDDGMQCGMRVGCSHFFAVCK